MERGRRNSWGFGGCWRGRRRRFVDRVACGSWGVGLGLPRLLHSLRRFFCKGSKNVFAKNAKTERKKKTKIVLCGFFGVYRRIWEEESTVSEGLCLLFLFRVFGLIVLSPSNHQTLRRRAHLCYNLFDSPPIKRKTLLTQGYEIASRSPDRSEKIEGSRKYLRIWSWQKASRELSFSSVFPLNSSSSPSVFSLSLSLSFCFPSSSSRAL